MTSSKVYKVGARGSQLSLIQTRNTLEQIKTYLSSFDYELVSLSSPGDRDLNTNLQQTPGDFFTADLDKAVLAGDIDFAVHSAKDLPYPMHDDLGWFWLPWREDARDAIVLPKGTTFDDVPPMPKIGVSSDRRQAYCNKRWPDYVNFNLRGTIEQRIEQLDNRECDVIIIAGAALNRLNLQDRIDEWISLEDLPAPEGQGAIAITFRNDNDTLLKMRGLFVHAARIIGAGPGMDELLTRAGERELAWCDVCLHDALISPSVLTLVNPNAELIDVGKRSQGKHTKQEIINQLLVDKVRQGRKVVRLKGGDPGIFGRLAEEVEALAEKQLPYQVFPGISSLNAATTSTGMMLTRRGISRGFTVMTPRKAGGSVNTIGAEERSKLPIVFFMGTEEVDWLCQELLAEGRPESEPVAIVYGAGSNNEIVIHGTLGTIVEESARVNTPQPGLMMVGETTHERFRYTRQFGALDGRRVLLTCSRELMDEACHTARSLGGVALPFPLIELAATEDACNHIDNFMLYDWVVLTSPSAVRCLMEVVRTRHLDIRRFPRIMSSGAKTSQALRRFGIHPDLEPTREYSDEALMEIVDLPHGTQVLRLRSEKADDYVLKSLIGKGLQVTDCVLYSNRNVIHDTLPSFDSIFFASGSAIDSFVDQFGKDALKGKDIFTIGKPSTAVLNGYDLNETLIAPRATVHDSLFAMAGYYVNQTM